MAAITSKTGGPFGRGPVALQTAATGTTTDWLDVPGWCNLILVHLRVTVAGTNTILTVRTANPVSRDDAAGNTLTIATSATITATGYHTYTIAPNVTTVADSATVNTASQTAGPIPSLIGVTTTPTLSTYTTEIQFCKV